MIILIIIIIKNIILEMFDHRLCTKNELVRQLEDLVTNSVDKLPDLEKQFYIGTKNYMKKNLYD